MKLSLQPTDRIVSIDGGPICRVWKGTTERGTAVFAYIMAVAVRSDECDDQEMDELTEIPEMEDPFLREPNG